MKKITLIYALLLSVSALFAQQEQPALTSIVEAEMKAAYNLANMPANLNTGDYDITYHRLDFEVNPGVHFIDGVITTTFLAKDDMPDITFDLSAQLTVSSVTMDGDELVFEQNANDELIITFPAQILEGAQATVVVTYSGQPPLDSDGFNTGYHNGIPEIWTLSEPYGAKDWWPCKQDLNDKIDNIDVYITAPSQYTSVSNGIEQSQVDNGNGTTTTHFRHNYPIPAYLIAIAVTEYTIYEQTVGTAPNTFPVISYVYPENFDNSTAELAVTPPIMDLYEDLFETYPFHLEKYGHAECSIPGGMEHTTVSFMGGFNRELIAHELAHQWFGDKITCGSWQDIWLNEGFATYLSGLVVEHLDGEPAFTVWKGDRIDYITSLSTGSVYVPETDTLNVSRVFSSRLTYNKGAMVVHMLRYKLGNENFYQGVKNYLADADLAYSYAKTPDLQAHLEAASGMDLEEFFQDWIYGQGYPSYTTTVEHFAQGEVKITINQTQSHSSVSYFEMPVTIRLFGANGEQQDIVLDNTFDGQEFIVAVPFPFNGMQFNPENDIICANNENFLGTTSLNNLASVQLYPNPASGQLHALLPQGVILEKAVFYNTLGQKVLESNSETTWNISGLADGVHFVTLITDKGSKQLRFIKE